MPRKKDDATPGNKLLRMFNILMCDARRHYQVDLVKRLQCSPQTVMRLAETIESVIGENFRQGLENRRKWYQMRTTSSRHLGLQFEELRYLSVCRDLAAPTLPEPVRRRVDETILNLSILMADQGRAALDQLQQPQLSFFSKGRIDYTPHFDIIDALMRAAEERRICLVRYKAGSRAEPKEHRFAPGRIVSMSGALYILGAGVTEDYQSVRHLTNLAVHRILDVTLTERTFAFDLPEASSNTFGLPWHEPRTFRIRFTPAAADYIRERTWADQQRLEDLEDGGVLLEITTRSEPELMAWVRSFGEEAEPVEPCPVFNPAESS